MSENESSYELLIQLDKRIETLTIPPPSLLSSSTIPPPQSPSATSETAATKRDVNLTKIQLVKFDGNPMNWQSFWDQFEATIHNRAGLSDVDKFNYLRNLLEKVPLEAISGLTLTTENYRHAIKLLIERYANPQILIHTHMESFVKLPKFKNNNNVKELRSIYNKGEMCVRNLKSLKVETKSYGSLLIPLLSDKIPDELLLLILRKFGNEVWTLEEMLTFMKEEIKAKERCSFESNASNTNNKNRPQDQSYTAFNLFSNTHEKKTKEKQNVCVYCDKNHPTSQCQNVTNVEACMAVLQSNSSNLKKVMPKNV